MKKTMKKVLAAVLAATMVIGMMAVSAFADDTDGYHVCGNEGLCGIEWGSDGATAANLMTENADGTYSITFTDIAAGTYEFKVELNNWENDWNLEGPSSGGGGNASVTVDEDGSTVVISFDGEKASVEVNPEASAPADDNGNTESGDSAAATALILAAVAALAVAATVSVKKFAAEK